MARRPQYAEIQARISVEDHEIGRRTVRKRRRVTEPGARTPGTGA
jgi:hypothetical protein